MQTKGALTSSSHQAVILSELGTTGKRCPQSSLFTSLMIQPLTSESKATAVLQIGPFKDFISKRTTQVMWQVNLTIMKGSTNKCRLLIKKACSERLQ